MPAQKGPARLAAALLALAVVAPATLPPGTAEERSEAPRWSWNDLPFHDLGPGADPTMVERFAFGRSALSVLLETLPSHTPTFSELPRPIEGILRIDQPTHVEGDARIGESRVVFAPGASLSVTGRFEATGTTFEVAPSVNADSARPRGEGPSEIFVLAAGSLELRRAEFRGVPLVIPDAPREALVETSSFHDGSVGILTNRAGLTVRASSFYRLGSGVEVHGLRANDGDAFDPNGPVVENSTFEMNHYGLAVVRGEGEPHDPAGHYHHNLMRGNHIGILCASQGFQEGGTVHRPLFERNNVYTNLGDAVAGVRGVVIPLGILGSVEFPDSKCDHDLAYLGPPGDAQDSVFLSGSDTLTNIEDAPNGNSAPPLPLALLEVSVSETWSGLHRLEGPVVVNSPATLTLHNAEVQGAAFLGAKWNGGITIEESTIGPGIFIELRNAEDRIVNSTIGTREGDRYVGQGAWMHRCNCSVQGSSFFGDGAVLVSGLITDDAVWQPAVRDTTFVGSSGIVAVGQVHADLEGVTIDLVGGDALEARLLDLRPIVHNTGILALLTAAVDARDSRVRGGSTGYTGFIGTKLTTDGAVFESLNWAVVLGPTDTFASSNDVFAANVVGLLVGIGATATLTGANVTFNQYGLLAFAGKITLTGSNLVDNVFLAAYTRGLVVQTVPPGGGEPVAVEVAGEVTCTSCWAPPDESWLGQVTYTAALAPNDVPDPSFAADVVAAGDGQTIDVPASPQGPVLARGGGTLRAANQTITMNPRFPFGAKGGGADGETTGRFDFDNVTLVQPRASDLRDATRNGPWSALVLNSTDSGFRHLRFDQGEFPVAPVHLLWNGGGTFDCVQSDHSLAVFTPGPGASPLTVRRFLYQGTDVGVFVAPDFFFDEPEPAATVLIEDSALSLGEGPANEPAEEWHNFNFGFFVRWEASTPVLHRNNFLSPARTAMRDMASDLDSDLPTVDASSNWWGHPGGPSLPGETEAAVVNAAGQDAGGPVPIEVDPPALQAFAPAPCVAFDVDPTPSDAADVVFRDRSFDPSGLGAERIWDFGDGVELATHETIVRHRYADGGDYTVRLTLRSGSQAEATVAKPLTVAHSPPLPAFDAAVGDELAEVEFTDRSAHGNPNDAPPSGWTYAWDFGDGNTSGVRNAAHRFADGGAHTVRLDVTDDDGLTNRTEHLLQVPHVAPLAGMDVQGALETDTFQLRDASSHPNAPTDANMAWSWACDDGFAATQRDAAHKFADGGSYACTHEVTDDDGLRDASEADVFVEHVAPRAGFGAAVADELTAVRFNDTSVHPNAPVDTLRAWSWTFGDGATGDARHPTKRYADGGTYVVTLTVQDDDGLTSERRVDVMVPHVAPRPAFGWSPPLPDPGEEAAFADGSWHPNAPHDPILAWQWDFGDGATSSEPSPRHAFSVRGVYDVTLTVTDDDGQVATVLRRVAIGNAPPVADFHVDPPDPTDLDTIAFTDASTDEDGTIASRLWDLGDGTVSDQTNVSHDYADDGLYVVTLTVIDDLGASTTVTREVHVRNVAPTANFTIDPQQPVAGLEIAFEDDSEDSDGTIVGWTWDFGDGTTSAAQSPAHTYTEGGDFAVRLTVTDDDGDATSLVRNVHVCSTGLVVEEGHIHLEVCEAVALSALLGALRSRST